MKKLKVKSQKTKVITAICIALVTLSGVEGWGQTARDTGKYSFSLQQAVDFSLKNQSQVLNAVYDEQIAQEKVKETRGIGLPQINANLDVKDFLEIPTSVLPASAFNPFAGPDELVAVKFGTKYSAAGGLTASQLLYSSDFMVGLQATKEFLDLSRKATLRTRIETTVAVSKAYYTTLLNNERMKLVDANIARVKKLMEDTKVLNANGFVEKVELDRITVSYNNLVVEKEKIQRLMNLGNSLLKFQMGMDQLATLDLTDNLSDVKFTPPADAGKFDYGNRVEYSLMQTQKNVSMLQLKRNKLAWMPRAALFVNASENTFWNRNDFYNVKFGWYPTLILGLQVNMGLFDGRQTHHRKEQSRMEIAKAENSMKMIQQSIDLEISNAKANLINTSASLETQKKNIELAESIYKASKLKYEQGIGSNLEVMSAETALKEAQTNYFSALYDALIAKVDYDKANGNIK